MAKKKRKTPGKSPKPSRRPRPDPFDASGLPDRRALEGLMSEFLKGLGGETGEDRDSPLHQAQMMMYEAFETDDRDEQVAMARRAIEVSPDCADAYVLLAENARTRKEALEF